jgi:4-hydroxythreonine-4-phosphate dehydrogenase
MSRPKPRILITTGDPHGVGPEIAVKALASKVVMGSCRPLLVGCPAVLKRAAATSGLKVSIKRIKAREIDTFWSDASLSSPPPFLPVIQPSGSMLEKVQPGIPHAQAGRMAFKILKKAHEIIRAGSADALVTCPINKEALHKARYLRVGHTEILAHLSRRSDPITLFTAGKLWIAFFTRHLALKDAVKSVQKAPLVRFVERLHHELIKLRKREPRLAIAALNPHAGEGGLFGKEEIREIRPAIEEIQNKGIHVQGPIPADAVFYQTRKGKFDCVVALYHDQGHIAAKTVHFFDTLSLTLGLPYLRGSVDHGTGFDIAWQNIARPDSLVCAIRLVARLTPLFPE